jgi:hypothetical protein
LKDNGMSDSTGLIAISFLAVTGLWLTLSAGRQANEMGLRICTGVVDGTTVPTAQRWHMLYNMWVPYQSGGFVLGVFLAVSLLLMASLVGNENVKLLGYLGAFMGAVGCLFWVLTGTAIFLNFRTVLREAEAG